ncbi:hypothetical protein [Streptomyces griseoluteus]
MELHLTRRHVTALKAENASLRAQLTPAQEHGHSHPHDAEDGHTHGS